MKNPNNDEIYFNQNYLFSNYCERINTYKEINADEQNEEQKRLITKLTNDNAMLRFELEKLKKETKELKAFCLNKDKTIEKYKDLCKQNSELKAKNKYLKNNISVLKIDIASLNVENDHLTSIIKDREEQIKEIKKINEYNSKRYDSTIKDIENFYKENFQDFGNQKQMMDRLGEAFNINDDNEQKEIGENFDNIKK